jgi:hypothetical protein
MKHYFFAYAITSLLTAAVVLGCNHASEDPITNGNGSTGSRSDCSVFMSFEIETTDLMRAVDPADDALLQPEDRALALPYRERRRVSACYRADGTREVVIEMLTPANPINYPANAVVMRPPVGYAKLVMADQTATFYDAQGGVIKTEGVDQPSEQVLEIVATMAQRQALTGAESAVAFEAMANSGMMVQRNPNDRYALMVKPESDGSRTEIIIDKQTQTLTGTFLYAADGTLESRTMMNIQGTADAPILKNILFEMPFTAISSDIPMRYIRHSDVHNFTITQN